MNSSAFLTALAAAVLGLSCLPAGNSATAPELCTPTLDRTCKPSGPIDVQLRQVREFGNGSVELELQLRPVLDMGPLRWSLQMAPGMQLIAGRGAGRLGLAKGELGAERVRVRLPANLGQNGGRLSVQVSGYFLGSSAENGASPERVVVTRSLSWGEPGAPGELPSTLQSGAGPVYKAGR